MKELQIYTFQNRPVRVAGSPENPLFVAADVCAVLEIANSRDAIASLDEDEKITVGNPDGNPRAGIPHQLAFVTESGLFALVFKSRKPEAKSFRKWVTSEVLPAIRMTGAYQQPGVSALDQFEAMIKAAREQERRLAEQDQKLAEVRALAIQANSYNSSDTGFLTVRAYAKIHGVRWSLARAQSVGQRVAKLCREDGIQTGRARDELFGQVNSYPVEVLDEICGEEIAKGGAQ
jgi:prophage antirepressor-like protein